MNFYEDFISQNIKTGYSVCGDHTICLRLPSSTVNILCDGIGSGIYANIAAIHCASRFAELAKQGISLQASCEIVATSMRRARTEDIPYAAFTVAEVAENGRFTIYNYAMPESVLWQNNLALLLKTHVYTTNNESLSVSFGKLERGDALLIFSDGVSQAGMGKGYGYGIGSAGVADFINKSGSGVGVRQFPKMITDYAGDICGGIYADDTTLSMLLCREAAEITILTGPPSKRSMCKELVETFMASPGKKVICGSTTADIVSQELNRPIQMASDFKNTGSPPEYFIEGIDLTAEGAVTLNQVCNLINEPPENLTGATVIERLCEMLHESDIVRIIIGNAINDTHQSLFFKQVGVKVRRAAVNELKKKLSNMGKLVLERSF